MRPTPIDRITDRLARGLGRAALVLGHPHDLHRPTGPHEPLDPVTRILRLHAAFTPESGDIATPGKPLRLGIFDTVYTLPGDILQGPAGTLFLIGQDLLAQPLLVLANRTVSLLRPARPTGVGVNPYGGQLRAETAPLMTNWPASILAAGHSGQGSLPADTRTAAWMVLLPPLPPGSPVLRATDLLTDDQGRTLTLSSAEQTAHGWRLQAVLTTT